MAQSFDEWKEWEKRWLTLAHAMDQLRPQLEPTDDSPPYIRTLRTMLDGLQGFARAKFYFFYDGFRFTRQDNTPEYTVTLEQDSGYPPQYVFRAILDQASYDLEVIKRAADQRESDDLKPYLEAADNLANQALQLARDLKLIDPGTGAITYFQKSTTIRVIPYAKVALIGVPLTAMSTDIDYLAIPHEIGHYVFRHGKYNDERIWAYFRRAVARYPAWRYNWVEEIFSDVYGCLVGGPVMALDFQDIQFEVTSDDFVLDDGHHPVPVLRPEIYFKVLEKTNQGNTKTVLSDHWTESKNTRGDPDVFTTQEGEVVELKNGGPKLENVVDKIVKMLVGARPRLTWLTWSDDTPNMSDVNGLYELPNIAEIKHKKGLTEGVFPSKGDVQDLAVWLQAKLQRLTEPPRIVPDVWQQLLFADGWATKGPVKDPTP